MIDRDLDGVGKMILDSMKNLNAQKQTGGKLVYDKERKMIVFSSREDEDV